LFKSSTEQVLAAFLILFAEHTWRRFCITSLAIERHFGNTLDHSSISFFSYIIMDTISFVVCFISTANFAFRVSVPSAASSVFPFVACGRTGQVLLSIFWLLQREYLETGKHAAMQVSARQDILFSSALNRRLFRLSCGDIPFTIYHVYLMPHDLSAE
jgi:hypothetical protein